MGDLTVAVYLSEHGFGHGVRSGWLLQRLVAELPRLRLVLATRLPQWLLSGLGRATRAEAMAAPPPLIQVDSLTVDHDESCRALQQALADWDDEVVRQSDWLRELGADLVYCDVPALPLEAARHAAIPAVALGNFTWAWIYERYADLDPRYAEAARRTAEAYGSAGLYLRLPTAPAEPSGMPEEDIPWIGRSPSRTKAEVRQALELPDSRPMVLLSFGGHAGIPVSELARSAWAQQVHLVGGRQLAATDESIRAVDEDGLAASGVEYIDLVAAADVVVSKPGYGMLADCLFARSRLVYLTRPEFPEASLLLEPTMQRLLGAIPIMPERRTAAGVAEAVDDALNRPPPRHAERLDGIAVAVKRLRELLD